MAAKAAWVYPRVCGGAWPSGSTAVAVTGLSPRVRGSRVSLKPTNTPFRSIPACAGEPGAAQGSDAGERVYPRVCGGAYHVFHRIVIIVWRSIPACAGEPTSTSLSAMIWKVDPRVCGGAIFGRSGAELIPGLSPRVRGSHVLSSHIEPVPRSILACAGEPSDAKTTDVMSGVYPRVWRGSPLLM